MIDEFDYSGMDVYHVHPVDDEGSHIFYTIDRSRSGMVPYSPCACIPRVEINKVNKTIIVVHNSFDGREGVEWANEILKN